MSKITFVEDDYCHIEYEIVEDECHVHCKVKKWTKSVAYLGYAYFVELKKHIKKMGYDCFYSITPNPKFCEMYGGVLLGRSSDREVFIWVT